MPCRLATLAVALSMALTVTTAQAQTAATPSKAKEAKVAADESTIPLEEIRRFVQVYQAVKQAYVEPIDDHELMQSAVRGLVRSLDPHSVYFEGDDADNFDERSRGNYQGIGVEVQTQDDGTLRIIAPIDGSPAQAAGIKAGDLVVAIDGQMLTDHKDDAELDMRGPEGTEIELTIIRKGQEKPLKIKVKRQTIKVASVRSRLLEPGYGYIRIASFQADTANDFESAVQSLQKSGALRGVLIDLRSNPGGLLNGAVQIADDLLPSGRIVSTRGRLQRNDITFDATPGDLLNGAKVVVLVDVGSASASEVLAGALRDHKRATIVGSRTFGKGSVQTLLPLDNGDSVKLTTARYFTPSGQSIQAIGIAPQVTFSAKPGASVSGEPGYSEVSLPGHIGAAGRASEDAGNIRPGDLLEGESYIEQALKILKSK